MSLPFTEITTHPAAVLLSDLLRLQLFQKSVSLLLLQQIFPQIQHKQGHHKQAQGHKMHHNQVVFVRFHPQSLLCWENDAISLLKGHCSHSSGDISWLLFSQYESKSNNTLVTYIQYMSFLCYRFVLRICFFSVFYITGWLRWMDQNLTDSLLDNIK